MSDDQIFAKCAWRLIPFSAPPMFLGPFWGFTSWFLSGRGAAGGIAIVSAIGSLGGFFGPAIIGAFKQESGHYSGGMTVLALMLLASALTVLVLGRTIAPRTAMMRPKVGAR